MALCSSLSWSRLSCFVLRGLLWRMMIYRRFERGLEARNIIIVGSGRVGQALRHHLDSIRHLGYGFKGYVQIPGFDSDSPPWLTTCSALSTSCCKSLASISRMRSFSRALRSSVVKRIVAEARDCWRRYSRRSRALRWPGLESPDRVHRPVSHHSFAPWGAPVMGMFLKRIIDVLLSSLAVVILSPLVAAIAVAMRLDSPGTVFYFPSG